MLLPWLPAATTVQTRFDASTLHDCPQVAMETGMVDDGSGSKMVNRCDVLVLSCVLLVQDDKPLSRVGFELCVAGPR